MTLTCTAYPIYIRVGTGVEYQLLFLNVYLSERKGERPAKMEQHSIELLYENFMNKSKHFPRLRSIDFRCFGGIRLSSSEMKSANRVQILEETVCISQFYYTLGYHSYYSPPLAMVISMADWDIYSCYWNRSWRLTTVNSNHLYSA